MIGAPVAMARELDRQLGGDSLKVAGGIDFHDVPWRSCLRVSANRRSTRRTVFLGRAHLSREGSPPGHGTGSSTSNVEGEREWRAVRRGRDPRPRSARSSGLSFSEPWGHRRDADPASLNRSCLPVVEIAAADEGGAGADRSSRAARSRRRTAERRTRAGRPPACHEDFHLAKSPAC